MSPVDGELNRELAANRVHSDQGRQVGRAEIALSIHVQNSSLAATGRPGLDARLGLEVEVVAVRARKRQSVGRGTRKACEGENVLAFAPCAVWDLAETLHLCIEDGKLEARVKFHVQCKLAVLAPVRGHGAWASLNCIG